MESTNSFKVQVRIPNGKMANHHRKPMEKTTRAMDLDGDFEIPTGSQLIREMAKEEEQERSARNIPVPIAKRPDAPVTNVSKALPKPADTAKGDWLTRTTIAKNSVGQNKFFQSRHPAPASKSAIPSPLAAHAARSFEMESDSQIASEMAEEARAFEPRYNTLLSAPKRTPSFPIPAKKTSSGRRQFSGLAPPPRRSAPPPSSPFDPPPSAQPGQAPSSTPIDDKRARKPLFFQEKPEDRESSVVFDSKLQAEKEERHRKKLEEEQKRQDEWMEELLGHRAAEEKEVTEERREVVDRQEGSVKAAIAKRAKEKRRGGEEL